MFHVFGLKFQKTRISMEPHEIGLLGVLISIICLVLVMVCLYHNCQENNHARRNSVSSIESIISGSQRFQNRSLRRSNTSFLLTDCKTIQYGIDEKKKFNFSWFKKGYKFQNSVCTICLDDFIFRETLTLCPCGHCYHRKCIKEWIPLNNNCPLCKRKVHEKTPLLSPV